MNDEQPSDYKCDRCQGDGWTAEAIHGCGGDDRKCAVICPVEEQVQCSRCDGSGRVSG